jgi:hypothetical protein
MIFLALYMILKWQYHLKIAAAYLRNYLDLQLSYERVCLSNM